MSPGTRLLSSIRLSLNSMGGSLFPARRDCNVGITLAVHDVVPECVRVALQLAPEEGEVDAR
jgi:hypothetical protein